MRNLNEYLQDEPSRRAALGVLGAFGLAAPFGVFSAANALTGIGVGNIVPDAAGDFPICRAAAVETPVSGPPRAIKLAWNASAICLSISPRA